MVVRAPVLQMGHNYLYAHISPKKLQNSNNKPAGLNFDKRLIYFVGYRNGGGLGIENYH